MCTCCDCASVKRTLVRIYREAMPLLVVATGADHSAPADYWPNLIARAATAAGAGELSV